eukprot:scaffold213273_cov18-Tisochrysis_lutea.AAC.1
MAAAFCRTCCSLTRMLLRASFVAATNARHNATQLLCIESHAFACIFSNCSKQSRCTWQQPPTTTAAPRTEQVQTIMALNF